MSVDYADWTVPQAHANAIANTGVPLLGASGLLLINNSLSIAAGTTFTSTQMVINQVSYEILVNLTCPGGTANPFAQVRLGWIDSAALLQMHTDTFIVPCCTQAGGFYVRGRGLAKADIVSVSIQNLDGANTITGSVILIESSRVYPGDDWHWDNGVDSGLTVPGFTLPTLPFDESIMGIVTGINVASGATSSWLFGMATTGQAILSTSLSGAAAANVRVHVFAMPTSNYGGTADLVDFQATNNVTQLPFNPPRAPVRVDVGVTGGGVAVTGNIAMIRLPA